MSAGAGAGAETAGAGEAPNLKLEVVGAGADPGLAVSHARHLVLSSGLLIIHTEQLHPAGFLKEAKSALRGEASFSVFPGVTGGGSVGRGLMLAPNTVSFLSPELPKLKPLVPELREKALPPPVPPPLGVLLPKLKASVPKLGVLGF